MKKSIKNLKPRLNLVSLDVHNDTELEIYQRSVEYGTSNIDNRINGINI